MKVLKWALLAALSVLTPSSLSAQEAAMAFVLIACDADPSAVTLRFKDATGQTRRVAFGDDGVFALKTEDTKGLLKFSDAVAIHLRQPRKDSEDRWMTIEYRLSGDKENQTIEAGVVDSKCLGILKDRYGKMLKFVEE